MRRMQMHTTNENPLALASLESPFSLWHRSSSPVSSGTDQAGVGRKNRFRQRLWTGALWRSRRRRYCTSDECRGIKVFLFGWSPPNPTDV